MAENLLITRMTSDDIDDVVLLDRSVGSNVILRFSEERHLSGSQKRR